MAKLIHCEVMATAYAAESVTRGNFSDQSTTRGGDLATSPA